jgi:hypothetical protein
MSSRLRSVSMTPRALASIAVILMLATGTAHAADAEPHEKLSGVWLVETPVLRVRTLTGTSPPFRPEAARVYQERIAERRAGDTSFDHTTWCASLGVPRLMFVSYPFEIVVRPKQVAFLYEWNWWARVVDMTGAALDVISPTSMGVATGKWEGSTLVVQTKGLEDTTLLDSAGAPHSEQTVITERFELKGADVLRDRITIDDPQTFTRPWETLVTYRRQRNAVIHEDVCLDRIKAGEPSVKGE